VVAIVLKGLQGPINVEGATFNGAMPAWEKTLADKKIAAVLSYVRSSFGNTAPEISESKVAAARAEFASKTDLWTEAQLQQIPADAMLPEAPGAAAAGAPAAGAPAAGKDPAAVLALGKTQYMTICVACHQPTGLGLPMVFPPLAKSEYVNGIPERFAAMVLKGNIGPMTVDGKPFNNVMPGQEMLLNDEKVAAVMTFVRSSFGNSSPPVSPDVVAAARKKFADRKTPWTEPELQAWKTE
jgi:mono/diheme cytochrome c family protein